MEHQLISSSKNDFKLPILLSGKHGNTIGFFRSIRKCLSSQSFGRVRRSRIDEPGFAKFVLLWGRSRPPGTVSCSIQLQRARSRSRNHGQTIQLLACPGVETRDPVIPVPRIFWGVHVFQPLLSVHCHANFGCDSERSRASPFPEFALRRQRRAVLGCQAKMKQVRSRYGVVRCHRLRLKPYSFYYSP